MYVNGEGRTWVVVGEGAGMVVVRSVGIVCGAVCWIGRG